MVKDSIKFLVDTMLRVEDEDEDGREEEEEQVVVKVCQQEGDPTGRESARACLYC